MTDNGHIFGLEEWRSFARPFFDVVPTGRREAFRGRATSRKLGRLVVSEVAFDSAVFDRDPRRLHDFDTEFLLLETYDSGANRGRGGDIVTGLNDRTVHVFDMAQPWRTQTTAVSCRSVVIPYDAIGYDPSRDPGYVHLPATSPRSEMVLSGIGALLGAGPEVDPDDAEALGASFATLVRSLMFNQSDHETAEAQLKGNRLLLRHYIDERLDDPNLGPQKLCSALHISRAALYRMFSEEGGIRNYITGRRLDRCFDELRQSPPQRGRVREVAGRWAFHDAKSFNRAFRARFGIVPSDCLGLSEEIGSESGVERSMQDWMRRL